VVPEEAAGVEAAEAAEAEVVAAGAAEVAVVEEPAEAEVVAEVAAAGNRRPLAAPADSRRKPGSRQMPSQSRRCRS
jgi:hypothetical protein